MLITLGIIGIVAALTMPALVANYRKNLVETKLKKVYSMMNQALLLSATERGADISAISPTVIHGNDTSYAAKLAWFDEYLAPYIKVQKVAQSGTNLRVYLLDGSILVFTYNGRDVQYHVNGKVDGNTNGKDYFLFAIYPGPECCTTTPNWRDDHYKNKPFVSYISFSWNGTAATLPSASGYVKIIQDNGWVVPEGYPIKF